MYQLQPLPSVFLWGIVWPFAEWNLESVGRQDCLLSLAPAPVLSWNIGSPEKGTFIIRQYLVTQWLTQPPLLRCSAFLNFDLILCLVPLLFRQRNLFWGAAIAQWIHLRLPSCRPGFDSQALHLCFYHLLCNSYYICTLLWKRSKINQKEAGFGPFLRKTFFVTADLTQCDRMLKLKVAQFF